MSGPDVEELLPAVIMRCRVDVGHIRLRNV
jgi:hypothetical protein